MASSSSGNATLVATERTRLLVDAGLSRRETFRRLAAAGVDPESLTAILVSHEHSDHVSGIGLITKVLRIPVYTTWLTAPSLEFDENFRPPLELFQAGTSFTIGDIDISSFSIPHDAIDPVGFCFKAAGVKLGVVTDLGYVPDSLTFHLRGTDCLLLESNHDLDMLKVGPYPWSVKQRVMSRRGHLSNDVVSHFIRHHLDSSTATLLLGHLSEHNNHPEIARITAQQAIDGRGLATQLVVCEPGKQSGVFTF